MVRDLAEALADGGPHVHAQDRRRGRIDEDDPPLGVDAEDALAGRFQDERGLGERALVEPPGDHAADA